MKVDLIRFLLRVFFFGFMLGRFKKRMRHSRSRGFVDVVFPLPAGSWKVGNDFLLESASEEFGTGDWLLFFGYRSPSGWRAKLVLRLF